MRSKNILIVLLLAIVFIALCRLFLWAAVGCGNDMVCHATQDHPPGCDEKGTTFFLKKNKGMWFMEKSTTIPDGAFYYLQKEQVEYDPSTYTPVMPIEVANYNNINLEDFVGKAVCIEGTYRYGLPTFLIDAKDLPTGMSEYEQIVVDIEEIRVVSN